MQAAPTLASDRPSSERVLSELLTTARDAHPTWIENTRFATRIGELAADTDDPHATLAALRAEDLYAATAAFDGVEPACASLEEKIRRTSQAVVGRMGGDHAAAEEIASEVIEKLLVGQGGQRKRIGDYRGRGSLDGWLRATLSRTYLNAKRKHKREVLIGDNAVLAALDTDHSDPTMVHMKAQYRTEFAAAFEEAIGTLSDRQRGVLRYRFVDGASVERISDVYRIHRATCHRWISDARAALAKATENLLRKRLKVSDAEIEAIRALVESQLELSLSRMFGG